MEVENKRNKWKIAFTVILAVMLVATISEAVYYENILLPQVQKAGREEGFWFVVDKLKDAGLEVNVEALDDGTYNVHFSLPMKGLEFNAKFELHMLVEHYRNGELLSSTYHTMTLTNYGKNWMEDKLSGLDAGGKWNLNATYIACSNSTDTEFAADTSLDAEITTDGLSRATNSTPVSTGDGAWEFTVTYSVSGSNSTKLYGVFLDAYAGATLIAAENQGQENVKNVADGDTLKVKVSGSVS